MSRKKRVGSPADPVKHQAPVVQYKSWGEIAREYPVEVAILIIFFIGLLIMGLNGGWG